MGDTAGERHLGRPFALDEAKQKTILAMLANGSSRRVAAAYVGCTPSTITRTAARDPEFDAALAHAEQNSEVRALRCLHNATRNERYWRAAAWLLERRNPDDFAAREPNVFTEQQVRQLFLRLLLLVAEETPQEKLDQLMGRLDELVEMLQKTGDLGPPPLPPPPDFDQSSPSIGRDSATHPTQVLSYLGE